MRGVLRTHHLNENVPTTSQTETSNATLSPIPEFIQWGSREGMDATVISKQGLDTNHAIIRVRLTEENARHSCAGYIQDSSQRCIEEQLRDSLLSEIITANCEKGSFTDFGGLTHQFRGKNITRDSSAPKYVLMNVRTKEVADGSMASGYGVNMGLVKALCPGALAGGGVG